MTGVDLEERLVQLPRTGDFGWLRNYGDPVVPILQAIRRRGRRRRGALLALVHLRGEVGLDAEDLAVVRQPRASSGEPLPVERRWLTNSPPPSTTGPAPSATA